MIKLKPNLVLSFRTIFTKALKFYSKILLNIKEKISPIEGYTLRKLATTYSLFRKPCSNSLWPVLLLVWPPKHNLTAYLLLLHSEWWPPKTNESSRQTFPAADHWARVLGRHGDVWQGCSCPKWTRADKQWCGKGCAHQKVTHNGRRRNIHLHWTSISIYCETSSPVVDCQCLQLMVKKFLLSSVSIHFSYLVELNN